MRGAEKRAAVGPIHPPIEDQRSVVVRRGPAEVQVQDVEIGDARVVALERVGIAPIACHERRTDVVSLAVARTDGIDALL